MLEHAWEFEVWNFSGAWSLETVLSITRTRTSGVRRSLRIFSEPLQLAPQQSVIRNDVVSVFALDGTMPEITPGRFQDQSACGNIPETNAIFCVGIHPPRRH